MMIDRPRPTEQFDSLDGFVPEPGSAYVFASANEDRTFHSAEWEARAVDVRFFPVVAQAASSIMVQAGAGGPIEVSLRSEASTLGLLDRIGVGIVYLDITGLTHNTWAPLVRSWIHSDRTIRVVYREPGRYNHQDSPSEGQLFELSDDFGGIKPLPGFARLAGNRQPTCFVPLLGFEGPRYARLLEEMDEPGVEIVPIVGVPGFRIEYPYHTFLGNKGALLQSRSVASARFAAANCPFSTLFLLEDIASEYSSHVLKLGLIGTKPHALGAVLYALRSRVPVELLHDHPVRSPKRSSGTDRVLVYHITTLEYVN